MNKFKAVNLFHIFFVSSLFLYIGTTRNTNPDWLYTLLLLLGFAVITYHLYGASNNLAPFWIHVMHFLIIGPLLVHIGYNGRETKRIYYEMMLLLGFASLGYHSMNYLKY